MQKLYDTPQIEMVVLAQDEVVAAGEYGDNHLPLSSLTP